MNQITSGISLYNLYELSNSKERNLILEPLSCLLKIALLQYKECGTKLSVDSNSLFYQEPTAYQGFVRTFRGDRREDLHNICKPLLQCLEWYDRTLPIYDYFYEQCRLGLLRLKDSYSAESTIHHTITHYIAIVEGSVGAGSIEDNENPIIDHLKDAWKKDEIKLVHDMLRLIDKNQDNEFYINCLISIVEHKEKDTYEYIKKISTTY